MPIKQCTLPGGGKGWKWGNSGKCYPDRIDAVKQAQAAYANGYRGDSLNSELTAAHYPVMGVKEISDDVKRGCSFKSATAKDLRDNPKSIVVVKLPNSGHTHFVRR